MRKAELYPMLTGDQLDGEPNGDARAAVNERGCRAVLERLSTTLGVQEPEERGEALNEFIPSTKFHRRSGERISEWFPSSRY